MNFIIRNYYYNNTNLDEVKITYGGLMFFDNIEQAYEEYEPPVLEGYTILNWVITEEIMTREEFIEDYKKHGFELYKTENIEEKLRKN